mmetsp:Transcript_21455/g.46498  ORF Transcript_21455/g.46498 Transcript_21455/m.46498 type:complete len:296 (+) Transcript_21455:182-1069(+)
MGQAGVRPALNVGQELIQALRDGTRLKAVKGNAALVLPCRQQANAADGRNYGARAATKGFGYETIVAIVVIEVVTLLLVLLVLVPSICIVLVLLVVVLLLLAANHRRHHQLGQGNGPFHHLVLTFSSGQFENGLSCNAGQNGLVAERWSHQSPIVMINDKKVGRPRFFHAVSPHVQTQEFVKASVSHLLLQGKGRSVIARRLDVTRTTRRGTSVTLHGLQPNGLQRARGWKVIPHGRGVDAKCGLGGGFHAQRGTRAQQERSQIQGPLPVRGYPRGIGPYHGVHRPTKGRGGDRG